MEHGPQLRYWRPQNSRLRTLIGLLSRNLSCHNGYIYRVTHRSVRRNSLYNSMPWTSWGGPIAFGGFGVGYKERYREPYYGSPNSVKGTSFTSLNVCAGGEVRKA